MRSHSAQSASRYGRVFTTSAIATAAQKTQQTAFRRWRRIRIGILDEPVADHVHHLLEDVHGLRAADRLRRLRIGDLLDAQSSGASPSCLIATGSEPHAAAGLADVDAHVVDSGVE